MIRFNVQLALLIAFSGGMIQSQAQSEPQNPQHTVSYARPNEIRSGFYLKMGPVFPLGNFPTNQVIIDRPPLTPDTTIFPAGTLGGNLGLGYLIYFGPAVANSHLRFGLDACFLDGWFVASNPNLPATSSKKETEFWYYFIGQKFGPLITINPVEKLMIDLSYKLNFNLSWHNSDYGYKIAGQEIMMNVRYKAILAGIHYTFGTINYNDFDKSRPVHNIDISTFRILLGFKF